GERLAITKYNQSLIKAYINGVQEAGASGLGFGVLYFVFICRYALGIWFSAKVSVVVKLHLWTRYEKNVIFLGCWTVGTLIFMIPWNYWVRSGQGICFRDRWYFSVQK
ncbi:hypothetical protein VIGAN_04094200, partial [Vigna angularis var. angularis]